MVSLKLNKATITVRCYIFLKLRTTILKNAYSTSIITISIKKDDI